MRIISCYSCYAYENGPGASCLVGEKQLSRKTKFGFMLYPERTYCKVKNKKDFIIRLEKQIENMRLK